MARPRKTSSPAVKAAAETFKEAPVKETAVKDAAPAAEKKIAAAKKTASAKTAAPKAAPKKADEAVSENIFIQLNGNEVSTSALVEKAKAESGIKDAKKVDIYVRPEINKVFYVIDGESFGNFELF